MSKEQYTYKVYNYMTTDGKVRWAFDILDNFDCVMTHGIELPELHEESPTNWATEEAADRNATKRVKELNK